MDSNEFLIKQKFAECIISKIVYFFCTKKLLHILYLISLGRVINS